MISLAYRTFILAYVEPFLLTNRRARPAHPDSGQSFFIKGEDMRYVRVALLSAAATWLLPFTPAVAELGHPSGCASCGPIEITAPTQGSYQGAPAIGNIGFPFGATALAPETGAVPAPRIRHVRHHVGRAKVH